MGGKRSKKKGVEKNRRLDAFLFKLQIEQDKREQIIKYVEDLTLNTLKKKSEPKLRLKR